MSSKLPALPRYRQKVRFVPAQAGRPVWVDDPHFNGAYHVRRRRCRRLTVRPSYTLSWVA